MPPLSQSSFSIRLHPRERLETQISSWAAWRRLCGHGVPQWGRFLLLLVGLLGAGPRIGYAQRQYDAWYFGTASALQFLPGRYWPQVVPNSVMNSFESCTSLADSTTGALLLYSNGERMWDRTHQPMPNGFPLGGHMSASEGALTLFAPGQPNLVYLFTTDAKESSVENSLRYSVVDLRLRNGLGDVRQRNQPLPLPGNTQATEHLAAIRQPNGRDYWILVHGLNNNSFYAYALTPAGLAAQPVVSAVGPVFSTRQTAETGTFRFSPSGRQLATTRLFSALDLFDFNPLTGQVSNPISLFSDLSLPALSFERRVYGVEFSGDGSLLYADQGGAVMQYDLLACDSLAIIRSKRQVVSAAALVGSVKVGCSTGSTGSFRRGPNGRLYIAVLFAPALAVIDSINSIRGTFLRPGGQQLAGTAVPGNPLPDLPGSEYGLPNCPGQASRLGPANCTGGSGSVEEGFRVLITPGCAGRPTVFEAQPRDPSRQGLQQVQWTIGTTTPLALSGVRVAPVFGQAGPQTGLVVVTFADGTRQAQRLQLTVPPAATVRLQASVTQLECGEPQAELTATANGPGRYRWADDTTTQSRRVVTQGGTYRVRFQSSAGCVVSDSVTIQSLDPSRCLIPNIITPNGDPLNQRFVLAGYRLGHWSLTIYNRWGRTVYTNPLYANEWDAEGQPAGVYYYLLQHPQTGTKLRGWVEVMR
ncbi:gliding motility-associated C-terminal domain-containing protein [Hymenobacter elongatus]|nr:gliding motility-associated C-terminal domain-containing protein [Hymenobacter elongatus]